MEDLVLEGLYQMRFNLNEREYIYQDWTRCSVGHVYLAANGKKAGSTSAVLNTENQPLARQMLEAIIDANPMKDDDGTNWATLCVMVSHMTVRVAREMFGSVPEQNGEWDDESLRLACLQMVNNAIEKIEADQRAAMLEIARWTSTAAVEDREPALV